MDTTLTRHGRNAGMADFARKAMEAADFLRELANEKRLLILCKLVEKTDMPVNELASEVGLGQSALSQHLARLREQKILTFRRDGATLFYSVADKKVIRILNTLRSIYC